MNTAIAAFTRNGVNLALRLADFLDGEVFAPSRFHELMSDKNFHAINEPLSVWTGKIFHEVRALIFVGACGIAVRAISQHVSSKLYDPAVIVIDETGKFVIPVLSGHVGGANELARKIAGFLHAQAVITTATDINNLPAIDEWAVKNNCVIENPEAIKQISSFILDEKAGYAVENSQAIEQIPSETLEAHSRIGVAVTCENIPVPFPVTLMLRPKVLVLGAGCNRGIAPEEFERDAKNFLDDAGVSILSLKALASIDIKRDEPAMKIFAEKHKIPFMTFTASQLQSLTGKFTSSQRVLEIVGTDNVCERACVFAAGEGAVLMRSKFVCENSTFALARCKS